MRRWLLWTLAGLLLWLLWLKAKREAKRRDLEDRVEGRRGESHM